MNFLRVDFKWAWKEVSVLMFIYLYTYYIHSIEEYENVAYWNAEFE